MTKTALANKELREKRGIERSKLLHDTEQQNKNRQLDWDKTRLNAAVKERGDKLNAGAKLGASAFKTLFALNDPQFYKGYIANLQDFVNVPHYDRLGNGKFAKLPYSMYKFGDGTQVNYDIPGIMIFSWSPVVGPQASSGVYRNPVNQSLAMIKQKVLALNSRSSVSWEAADLGYNLFCSADIMSAIEDLGRVIRVYQTYSSTNAYLAKELITALGWSYDDIHTNFAEYRKTYDILARKFNSAIVVPASVGLMKRRAYLAQNVFIDSEDATYPRQMYAFVQRHFFRLTDDGSICNIFRVSRTSISQFSVDVMQMISRIADNPDFSEMYQDLRHAFGSDLYQLPESNTLIEQPFNTDVLNREQIHNMDIAPTFDEVGPTIREGSWALRQDEFGYLYQGADSTEGVRGRRLQYPTVQYVTYQDDMKLVLAQSICNMHKKDVTGDDIIDITRLKATYRINEITTDQGTNLTLADCGTEFVVECTLYAMELSSASGTLALIGKNISTEMYYSTNSTACLRAFLELGKAYCFDWAPMFSIYVANKAYIRHISAETTFILSREDIANIHEACVLGEIYYPDTAFKSTFR